jgi:hypothetical protein
LEGREFPLEEGAASFEGRESLLEVMLKNSVMGICKNVQMF